MYRMPGSRIHHERRFNASRLCTPLLFIIIIIIVPFWVYMWFEMSRSTAPIDTRTGHDIVDAARLLPANENSGDAADHDAARHAQGAGSVRMNNVNMLWYAVDIVVPDGESGNLIRFPRTGGFTGIRTSTVVKSYMQCLKHSNELILVEGGTPEQEHFHYVIREHRQSGQAFIELHRGGEQLSDLVWCKFYVLTTAIGIT